MSVEGPERAEIQESIEDKEYEEFLNFLDTKEGRETAVDELKNGEGLDPFFREVFEKEFENPQEIFDGLKDFLDFIDKNNAKNIPPRELLYGLRNNVSGIDQIDTYREIGLVNALC